MNRYVSDALRRLVSARAEQLCEYCLIDSADTFFGGEVDHIISVKHGGATALDNLAYTCQPCNRNKGSDLGSIDWPSGHLVRFFHPRTDRWADHFRLHGARISPLTTIGEVTARILDFNGEERLQERHGLIAQRRYPSPAARARMHQ
ncbi:MAG: HNH endonuclease [Candidatus Tectomicrobia bacterium]|uniref:HNH endonuclease n=1 Tax=Tectimicrobiota bacterium TaxID=2528274 RepID=A0A938B4Q8_UNCTE|nr:HNH endonuclease [Candidatus Tectomicrobia bacterium]